MTTAQAEATLNLQEELQVLERIFLGAATRHHDTLALSLIPAILEQATAVHGYKPSDAGTEGHTYLRAKKAGELLRRIPAWVAGYHHCHELTETRRLLWQELVDGVLCAYNDQLLELGRLLLQYQKLSQNERNTLKEVLKEGFDGLSSDRAHKLKLLFGCLAVPGFTADCTVARGIAIAWTRYASENELAIQLARLT